MKAVTLDPWYNNTTGKRVSLYKTIRELSQTHKVKYRLLEIEWDSLLPLYGRVFRKMNRLYWNAYARTLQYLTGKTAYYLEELQFLIPLGGLPRQEYNFILRVEVYNKTSGQLVARKSYYR